MNFYQISGIPSDFGVVLLTLSLILLLTPYFSGVDFGIIKTPKLRVQTQKRLKTIGPLIMIICLLLYLPIWNQFFRITLFPRLGSSASPLLGQSIRIGTSDANYRIEVSVRNPSETEDRLIDRVMIIARSGDDNCAYLLSPPSTSFEISDELLLLPDEENAASADNTSFSFQGAVTEEQDRDFVYQVIGSYTVSYGCETVRSLTLSFDTSIVVPKNSPIQFQIILPRDLHITNHVESSFSDTTNIDSTNIDSLLDVMGNDVLKSFPYVEINVWDSEVLEPILFVK